VTPPEPGAADAPTDRSAPPGPASPMQLFLVFTGLALRGFGGVLPWAQRVLVEERRWLTRDEFLEVLAFGQLLPGPNICNLSIMLGDRWFGWRGAVAALAGMLGAPTVVVLGIGVLYGQFAEEPVIARAVAGMGAVAGGMILATAVKLAVHQRARWRWLGFGVVAFVCVALLRMKLAWVLAVLVPAAVAAAWYAGRRLPGRDRS
jgi:chromate transporter